MRRKNHDLASAKKPKNFSDREMATIMAFLGRQRTTPQWIGEIKLSQ